MAQPTALTPELAVRLLRAKAAALENEVLLDDAAGGPAHLADVTALKADLALIAEIVAQHIERSP